MDRPDLSFPSVSRQVPPLLSLSLPTLFCARTLARARDQRALRHVGWELVDISVRQAMSNSCSGRSHSSLFLVMEQELISPGGVCTKHTPQAPIARDRVTNS